MAYVNQLNHFLKRDSKSKNKLGWRGDIEQQTVNNPNYRKVLFTGGHSQLVLMNLKPRQSIGNEVHPKVDQFFRIEKGTAQFNLANGKEKFIQHSGGGVVVPAGTYHNVTNKSSNQALKLYTIYSPKNHPDGLIQRDRPSKDRFINKTGTPLFDNPNDFGRANKYKVSDVELSPREYLELAQSTSQSPESRSEDLDQYLRSSGVTWHRYQPNLKKREDQEDINQAVFRKEKYLDELKDKIKDPNKEMDMPFIEYDEGKPVEHEGRHRALAALELGLNKIPVRLINAPQRK